MARNSVPYDEVKAWLLAAPEAKAAYDALEPDRTRTSTTPR